MSKALLMILDGWGIGNKSMGIKQPKEMTGRGEGGDLRFEI